jgi:hypothetical protein
MARSGSVRTPNARRRRTSPIQQRSFRTLDDISEHPRNAGVQSSDPFGRRGFKITGMLANWIGPIALIVKDHSFGSELTLGPG